MGEGLIHPEREIIERLKKLPPQQLDEVIRFIDFIAGRRDVETAFCKAEDVKRSILDLRGRGKGEHLVERLLLSRREDKQIDDRK